MVSNYRRTWGLAEPRTPLSSYPQTGVHGYDVTGVHGYDVEHLASLAGSREVEAR